MSICGSIRLSLDTALVVTQSLAAAFDKLF